MKRTAITGTVAIAAALAVVLSGCGSDTKTAPSTSTSSKTSTSSSTSKKAAPSSKPKVAPRDEDAKGPNPTIASYATGWTLTATSGGKGDCGTIQEMKWTGWHFRLLNAWSKDNCDGELFEWDSREKWQVFPAQAVPQQGPERDVGGSGSTEKYEQASR